MARALSLAMLLVLLTVGQATQSTPVLATEMGRILFAANWQGNWDLYHLAPDGTDLRRLTTDPAADRDPAWSPDGTRIAFRSHRDGNWELYVLDLASRELARLTDDPAFDGQPAWSPDGTQIAFVSNRAGDPDILVMPAAGGDPINLTSDIPETDFAPAWSPDGSWIAFTSKREGDNDLFIMDPQGEEVRQLTISQWQEEWPRWSPDGQHLVYAHRDYTGSAAYQLEVDHPPADDGPAVRLSWLGGETAPALSPDGEQMALIQQLPNSEALWVQPLAQDTDVPVIIEDRFLILAGPLSWSSRTATDGVGIDLSSQSPLRPEAEAAPTTEGEIAGFYRVQNLIVPNERVNARIADAFMTLRERVVSETGWDFLGELSDSWRPLEAYNDTSSYGSWHKAARAMDIRFDLRDNGNEYMFVAREDLAGRSYWRVYLRPTLQDGTLGEPLFQEPWDFSGTARRRYPDDGGKWEWMPAGYFVDLTALIREYGWNRIPGADRPDYSWKWHFLAIEYWHFERPDGMSWYEGMLEVYPEDEVADVFDWREFQRERQSMYLWRLFDLPVPPESAGWLDLRP